MRKQRAKKPIADRFWPKVKIGTREECWPWTGALNGLGYGVIAAGDEFPKCRLATRLGYQLTFGRITSDICVLHACDNPICVNPNHLWLGTKAENSADMSDKDRAGKATAVLLPAQIPFVRAELANGIHIATVAKNFGVHRRTIFDIREGRTWKHA